MPQSIDKVRAEKYKLARFKGKSVKQSLIEAGYSPAYASKSTANAVVRVSEPEVQKAIMKASEVTVEWVVNQLLKELVAPDAKASDRIRVAELLGKYLNMFKEAQTTTQIAIFQEVMKELPKIEEPPKIIEPPETPKIDNANPSNSTS